MSQILIDTLTLAEMLSISARTLEKKRHKVVGATRIGRLWRFDRGIIEKRLSVGKSIFRD